MFPDHQSIPILQQNERNTEDSTKIKYDKDSNDIYQIRFTVQYQGKMMNESCRNANAILSCLIGKLVSHTDQAFSRQKGYGEQCPIPQDARQVDFDLLNDKKNANGDLAEKPSAIHFDIGELFADLSTKSADSKTEEVLESIIAQIPFISSQMRSDTVSPDKTGNINKADFIQTVSLAKELVATVLCHIKAAENGNESTTKDIKSDLFTMQPEIMEPASECDVKSPLSEIIIRSNQNETYFQSGISVQDEQIKNMQNDESGKTIKDVDNFAGVLSFSENITNQDGVKIVHPKTESPDINHIFRNIPVMTKEDGTTIKVSLEPDGIGKLDIHLSLDRGVVNAKIGVSEVFAGEFIERNILNIVTALNNEGIDVGSFSVYLKDRRKEFKDEEKN